MNKTYFQLNASYMGNRRITPFGNLYWQQKFRNLWTNSFARTGLIQTYIHRSTTHCSTRMYSSEGAGNCTDSDTTTQSRTHPHKMSSIYDTHTFVNCAYIILFNLHINKPLKQGWFVHISSNSALFCLGNVCVPGYVFCVCRLYKSRYIWTLTTQNRDLKTELYFIWSNGTFRYVFYK